MKPRTMLSGLVLLATLVAIGYGFESGLFGGVLDERWIDSAVRGHGIAGELVFVGVAALATALAVPRQIVSFLGGYGFGFALGTLLALAGTELGCLLAFVYARAIGRPLVGARLGARVQRLERFLALHPFAMTLLVRLLPVGHNLATTLAAGVSRIPIAPFLLGSLVGYVPQTIVFALAGSGVQVDAAPRIALAAAMFVVSTVLGTWLYRRYRHGSTLGPDVDAELEEVTGRGVSPAMNVLRSDRWLAGLLAGWAAFAIASIWLRPLWPVDETRYASVAWEMWLRGDFVVPYVNGEPYAHKPPLLFWLIHAGWLVFGVNDWWPRMVGPLCAAAAVPLIVRLERLLWPGGEARGLPVWVLFGSLLFAAFVTLTMFDLLLMLCAMVGVIGIVRAAQGERIAGFAWLGAGIALGVLAKGPVILVHVLPVALVAPWWAPATRASWRSWYAGILCALAGGAAIALAWAIPAALSGGPEYARAIFWGQTAGRVAESFAHRAPWWYYVPLLPVIFFPWLVWPALWRGARHAARSQAERFLGAWLVLVIVAFSLVSGKQAKYLVPLLPAFALLAGRVLAQPGLVARSRFIALPAVGFAVAGAALAYARLKAGAPGLPEWTAAIPWWPTAAFVAIAVTLAMLSRKPALAQVRALAFAVLAATVTLGAGVVPAIADYNDVTPVARRIAELQARGLTVAFFGKYHAQFNFAGRLQSPVDIVGDEDLADWVAQHPDGIVVETEREQHAAGSDGPESEAPFRGGFITVWQGANLLTHHLSEQ